MKFIPVIALCAHVALAFPLKAAERIDWLVQDSPPYLQATKPRDPATYFGHLLAALPAFEHNVIPSTHIRTWHDIGVRDGVCTFNVRKNKEREKVALFTNPLFTGEPFGMFIRAEDRERIRPALDKKGEVELRKLPPMAIGYMRQRSYGAVIDEFLKNSPTSEAVLGTSEDRQLFLLLLNNRIDVMFSDRMAINSVAEEAEVDRLVFLPVAGALSAEPGYVACSRGRRGQAAIAEINRALAGEYFVDARNATRK